MRQDPEPAGPILGKVVDTTTEDLDESTSDFEEANNDSPGDEESQGEEPNFAPQGSHGYPPLDDEELKDQSDSGDEPRDARRGTFGPAGFHGPVGFGDGPVAGRDNIFNLVPKPAAPMSGPVATKELDRLAATYVEVAAFDQLREELRHHRVQVLRGQHGTGRMTTALLALRRLGKPVYRINAPDELRSLAEPGLHGGAGYAMELIRDEHSISAGLLDALRDYLGRVDAYLVVVVDDAISLDGVPRNEYVVSYSPPSAMEVFDRHLDQIADDARDHLYELRDTAAAIRDEVHQASGPAAVATLVDELAAAVRDGRTVEQIQLRLRTSVKSWLLDGPPGRALGTQVHTSSGGGTFHPHRTLWDVATLLACCVLNGYPLGRVVAAAEPLAVSLYDIESPGTRPPRPVLRDSVLACETFVRITEPHEPGSDWFSRLHTPRVRLRDPEVPKVVFEVIWREFSAIRGPFVRWLRNLADSVRGMSFRGPEARAIDAIGLLAQIDFDYIYWGALRDWAASSHEFLNFAAVRALETAAQNDHVTSTIRQVLRTWSRADASPTRRRTALLAYANHRIGDHLLDDMLRAVRHTPASMRLEAARAIARVVIKEHADRVLADLAERVSVGDTEAIRLFIVLAGSGIDADVPDLRVRLLTGSATSTEHGRALTQLWTAALDNPSTTAEAWQCLRGWVALADDGPELLAPLGVLMDALMTAPHLEARLPFVLRLWHGGTAPPERAAQFLLARVARM